MYQRKYRKDGTMGRKSLIDELKAIHGLAHHYSCSQDEDMQRKGHHYSEQEKNLENVLMDVNSHIFDKLMREYLAEYPSCFCYD